MTDGRTLAIVLGTVIGGLLVILVVIFIACYIAQRWPWLTVASRRTRILRAEVALDNGDNPAVQTRPSTLRMFNALERIKPYRPSLERGGQTPSAPKDSLVELTELDMGQDQPTLVRSLFSTVRLMYLWTRC